MHELSLCRMMMDIIYKQFALQTASRVIQVNIEIGRLAAVDLPALRLGFEAVSKDTIADQAIFNIIVIEGQGYCEFCERVLPMQNKFDACQSCGQYGLKVIQGEELQIKSMEVI